MVVIEKVSTNEDFQNAVDELISIFIDEYPYYSRWINSHMNQFESGERQILSIKENGALLGYIMIHFLSKEIVKFNGLYIFEQYKGKGFATLTLSQLTKKMTEESVKYIYAQTRLDNNAVVHIFEKTGFELIGTNYHDVELKNNWVVCYSMNQSSRNKQIVAKNVYDSFVPLTIEEIQKLREEYKNGNLVLKRTRRNSNEKND